MKEIYTNERNLYKSYDLIAGVDEAGRGPLAGPVVVSAVILGNNCQIEGLNDSKKISEKKRNLLYDEIIEKSLSWSIVEISPQKIDEINILQATLLGMSQAISNLNISPEICLIDGNQIPKTTVKTISVIKGDSKYISIAAASILAKVTRDRIMIEIHKDFPLYNFQKHKGYPTKEHREALKKYGICPHHRKSYKPVSLILSDR